MYQKSSQSSETI
jgi:hypothetical protein